MSDGDAASASRLIWVAATLLIGLLSASPGRREPAQVNTIQDVLAKLRTCWKPPPAIACQSRIDITVIVSFNRAGDILGHPRITYESEQATDNDRLIYRIAVMEALQRCTPMPFTEAMAGAVAGRPFAIQFRQPETFTPTRREESMADTENTLILETTQGPVTIEMRPDLAPGHVARIKELVREGFYDGIVFHRVIEGFMAQTGCPQGTGTGGSGKKLKAEFNKEPHVRGTTSMARAASPDSGDSQFFICFDDASFLNNQYTVWGKVTVRHGERRQDQARRAGAEPRQDRQGPHGRRRGVIANPPLPAHAKRRSRNLEYICRFRIADARHAADFRDRRRCSACDAGIVGHAHRSLRLRTSSREHRAAPGEPARFRAECWSCSPTACCATAGLPISRNGSSPATSWS